MICEYAAIFFKNRADFSCAIDLIQATLEKLRELGHARNPLNGVHRIVIINLLG